MKFLSLISLAKIGLKFKQTQKLKIALVLGGGEIFVTYFLGKNLRKNPHQTQKLKIALALGGGEIFVKYFLGEK